MSIQRLRPTANVNISFDGRTVEVQYADGAIYSKESLCSSSRYNPDPHEPEDSFYATEHEDFAAEVKEFTVSFIRKETIEYDTEIPDSGKTIILE